MTRMKKEGFKGFAPASPESVLDPHYSPSTIRQSSSSLLHRSSSVFSVPSVVKNLPLLSHPSSSSVSICVNLRLKIFLLSSLSFHITSLFIRALCAIRGQKSSSSLSSLFIICVHLRASAVEIFVFSSLPPHPRHARSLNVQKKIAGGG